MYIYIYIYIYIDINVKGYTANRTENIFLIKKLKSFCRGHA